LRIVFMGTPELARVILEALLHQTAFTLCGVVTQPDRPKGRALRLQPSPVKDLAIRTGLPVLQPSRSREEGFLVELRQLQPELIAVAAFGQILPKSILDLPRFGCLNVHTSLLPRYRGAAPIQWSILNGDSETGVTITKMDTGLDTGDIVAQRTTLIEPADNAQTLHDSLAQLGADLLARTIPEYVAGRIQPRPQPSVGVSHAPKIKKEDGRIDWSLAATAIMNRIRAFTPWPGAFTFLPAQPQLQLLKIWDAAVVNLRGAPGQVLLADKSGIVVGCAQQSLRIISLQREGGRRMSASDFIAGHPLQPGEAFGIHP